MYRRGDDVLYIFPSSAQVRNRSWTVFRLRQWPVNSGRYTSIHSNCSLLSSHRRGPISMQTCSVDNRFMGGSTAQPVVIFRCSLVRILLACSMRYNGPTTVTSGASAEGVTEQGASFAPIAPAARRGRSAAPARQAELGIEELVRSVVYELRDPSEPPEREKVLILQFPSRRRTRVGVRRLRRSVRLPPSLRLVACPAPPASSSVCSPSPRC